MKKLIFRKLIKDFTKFFLLVSISITLIVWVIQAVNYLDIVTEDGHGFQIYFLYTLLSLPKIFSKVLPFIFFISLFYLLIKYENENELIIFWTVGIKKIQFVNVLIIFSFFYLIFQLIFTSFIVPQTLDKARSFIRSSNVDLFSSIIKEKKFIDTVKDLTIFVEEKKENGQLINIFLKEKIANNKHQIIFAKNGIVKNKLNKKFLLLFDGKILNSSDSKTTSLKFDQTELNLSKFSTKTITYPKIQEISTYEIVSCIFLIKNLYKTFIKDEFELRNSMNCNSERLNDSFQEIFKRILLPFYIPSLTLIASLIILKSKDDFRFSRYKFILFCVGVVTILISELSIKYSSTELFQNIPLLMMPVVIFILVYFYFLSNLKILNLIKK